MTIKALMTVAAMLAIPAVAYANAGNEAAWIQEARDICVGTGPYHMAAQWHDNNTCHPREGQPRTIPLNATYFRQRQKCYDYIDGLNHKYLKPIFSPALCD
jgi:hypothetical protein